MTAEQIKNIWENCPKAKVKLIEWFKKQLPGPTGNSQIDIPLQEAFKNAEKALQLSLGASPRFLYEFFDDNNIFLSVGRFKDSWVATSNKVDKGDWDGNAENRKEIEDWMFHRAFNFLESYLTYND